MGIIFDIKKFAIYDGPGIRTTVFLKGCPLRCWWCHNPESFERTPELSFGAARCIGCGKCFEACKTGALTQVDGHRSVDPAKCTLCGACVEACPTEALKMLGRDAAAAEVIAEIEKDAVFYEESGGGVTFSGGEPLMQPEFLAELLAECKARGIHTAVDTTCHAPWETIQNISPMVDLFLVDLKHINPVVHRETTGVSNELILENLSRLAELDVEVIVRIPLIPGVNDDENSLSAAGRFVASLGNIARVDVLPYNEAAQDKLARLADSGPRPEACRPSEERIRQAVETLQDCGLKVKIGG